MECRPPHAAARARRQQTCSECYGEGGWGWRRAAREAEAPAELAGRPAAPQQIILVTDIPNVGSEGEIKVCSLQLGAQPLDGAVW
jgi:hypothetical protein